MKRIWLMPFSQKNLMQMNVPKHSRDRRGSGCHIWFSGSPWLSTNTHRVRRKLKRQNDRRNKLKKKSHRLWTSSGSHCFSLLGTKCKRKAGKVLCGFVFLGNKICFPWVVTVSSTLGIFLKFYKCFHFKWKLKSHHFPAHFLRVNILRTRQSWVIS